MNKLSIIKVQYTVNIHESCSEYVELGRILMQCTIAKRYMLLLYCVDKCTYIKKRKTNINLIKKL